MEGLTYLRKFFCSMRPGDLSPGPGPPEACVPEGRPNTAARSIPKVSFFKADTVFLQKTDIFFLEAPEPMILHMILDIVNRFSNMRDTDRERSVTRLP